MKELMKRLNLVIKYSAHLLKTKFKDSKMLLWMDIVLGICKESKAIILMILPTLAIQLVVKKSEIDIVLVIISSICLIFVILSFTVEKVQRALSNYSIKSLNYFILYLNKKNMNLDLETVEKKENIEKFDKAYDGIWESMDVDFMILSVIFSKAISFGITFYVFSSIHWGVAFMAGATLLIEFVLGVKCSDKIHGLDWQQSEYKNKKNYVTDVLFDNRINKDIYINHATEFFINKYTKVANLEYEIEKEKNYVNSKNDIVCSIISTIRTAVIYLIAVFKYVSGSLPIGNFLMFSTAVNQMTYAIWQIMQGVEYLFKAGNYYKDYLDYTNIEDDKDKSGLEQISDEIESIEFRNVSYQYPNQSDCAVNNISFKINKGEIVAVVGDNGAGKSTIIKLLLRLYKVTSGEILVNGKNIYSYDYESYQKLFMPVFQDYMMYAFSIKENMVFDSEKTDKECFDILEKVGLSDKVNSLPNGINSEYTKKFYEDGIEFSGGEEQKLAIARAFAKSGKIMVLDEPSSALDPIAEYNMYQLVHRLRREEITIFVSHRLSSTRFADKIIVMDDGSLKQEGKHQDLISIKGLYQRMYELQTQYYKTE